MIYIIYAILIFGLLITVHELGHFITAKLSGIRVNEFAIGMGPAIFKYNKGETQYSLRLLPIGGYVKMEGEDEEAQSPRSFSAKPAWIRFFVLVSGAVMNIITGFVIVFFLYLPMQVTPTLQVAGFKEDMPNPSAAAGMLEGDVIHKFNGYKVSSFDELNLHLSRADGTPVDIEVKRAGEIITLSDITLPKIKENVNDMDYEYTARDFLLKTQPATFFSKIKFSIDRSVYLVKLIWYSLIDIITGKIGVDQLSGPVGVTTAIGDAAKRSMTELWFLAALIAMNLGVFNLLPLPALDGGRIAFVLVELVRGKPIKAKYEGYVHLTGFVLLMLLTVFIAYKDIVKLFAR